MDCLEFRRLIGADPRTTDPAARAHLETCARCQDAYSRAQAFEARIANALNVAVPEGLADRVLLKQLTVERRRGGLRHGWIALAAAAALVVAIGLWRLDRASTASLPALAVAHIEGHEKPALAYRDPIAAANVERAFADRGVALKSVPAGVSYVNKCPLGDWRTVHMVMPEGDQPVSVFYVANYHANGAENFQRGGFAGREVPLGDGTLLMLAANDAHFDALEHTWRNALEGPAAAAAGSP
jgi:hypothetical protein